LLALSKLKLLAQEISPDIVMTYGGPESVLAGVLWGKTTRFRGHQISRSAGVLEKLRLRASTYLVRKSVFPSAELLRRFSDITGALGAFLPIGLDEARFTYQQTQKLDHPILTIVGRLDPIKGHEGFLSVFKHLLANWSLRIPLPKLRIVGEPCNVSREQILRCIDKNALKIGQDVELITERVTDVPLLMAETTVGIVPSLGSELICRVGEEFLLCGVPIFVSGVGSLEELCGSDYGISYRGAESDSDIASLLKGLVYRSWHESQAMRCQRSRGAITKYSLGAMGIALESLWV
jgi:glycosyltransferase involved in cell wall biosynthesis